MDSYCGIKSISHVDLCDKWRSVWYGLLSHTSSLITLVHRAIYTKTFANVCVVICPKLYYFKEKASHILLNFSHFLSETFKIDPKFWQHCPIFSLNKNFGNNAENMLLERYTHAWNCIHRFDLWTSFYGLNVNENTLHFSIH